MFVFTPPDSSQSPPQTRRLDEIVDHPEGEATPPKAVNLSELVPLSEAHRHLPRRADGKKIHRTTLGRWASKGCRGVVLQTWLIGGIRFTNSQAIAEFVGCLTASKRECQASTPPAPANADIPTTISTRTRRAASSRDRIEEDLKRFGL